jgi:hypothetical protein
MVPLVLELLVRPKGRISTKGDLIKTLSTTLIDATLIDEIGTRPECLDRPPCKNNSYTSLNSSQRHEQ